MKNPQGPSSHWGPFQCLFLRPGSRYEVSRTLKGGQIASPVLTKPENVAAKVRRAIGPPSQREGRGDFTVSHVCFGLGGGGKTILCFPLFGVVALCQTVEPQDQCFFPYHGSGITNILIPTGLIFTTLLTVLKRSFPLKTIHFDWRSHTLGSPSMSNKSAGHFN